MQTQYWLCSIKIGTKFLACENVQENLEIAQISRLCGIYTMV